jgi:hypothetical protein
MVEKKYLESLYPQFELQDTINILMLPLQSIKFDFSCKKRNQNFFLMIICTAQGKFPKISCFYLIIFFVYLY